MCLGAKKEYAVRSTPSTQRLLKRCDKSRSESDLRIKLNPCLPREDRFVLDCKML